MNETTTATVNKAIQDASAALSDLLNQSLQVSRDLVTSLNRSGLSILGAMAGCRGAAMPRRRASRCGCEIPPACWAPQPLGELTSHVCPGGTATVRLRITNCGITPRSMGIEAQGKVTGITVAPATLNLKSMERGVAVVSLPVPGEAACGQEFEALIWVHGCHNHYLRWTVKAASRAADSCHEIEVEDCPDLVHHWYDHFYCQRPCFGGKGG